MENLQTSNEAHVLPIINQYLEVFNKPKIDKLDDLPEIEKTLFENDKLKSIVNDNIEELKNKFGPKDISYYDRNKMKHYPFILFKKMLELSGNPIKIKPKNKTLGKGQFQRYSVVCL
jgi:hypothetical protein